MNNPHETRARTAKAVRLASKLAELYPDMHVPHITKLDEQGRNALAALADTNPPSAETWEMVCALLQLHDQHPELFKAMSK